VRLIRAVRWPIGSRRDPQFETRQVGIRSDALTDEPCSHCWGTGRRLRGVRSLNCEEGNHTGTCIGNTDPRQCICFCHQEVADERKALTAKEPIS
jgi:hypothetical protein